MRCVPVPSNSLGLETGPLQRRDAEFDVEGAALDDPKCGSPVAQCADSSLRSRALAHSAAGAPSGSLLTKRGMMSISGVMASERTIGSPEACASIPTIGNPSKSEGSTKASIAPSISRGTSPRDPANVTRLRSPSRIAFASTAARNSPLPTSSRRKRGSMRAASAATSSKNAWFFCTWNRPTCPTTNASFWMPSSPRTRSRSTNSRSNGDKSMPQWRTRQRQSVSQRGPNKAAAAWRLAAKPSVAWWSIHRRQRRSFKRRHRPARASNPELSRWLCATRVCIPTRWATFSTQPLKNWEWQWTTS